MKNTKAGRYGLIFGVALLLGSAQAWMPTIPREMGSYTSSPDGRQALTLTADTPRPGAFLQEYSVYTRNEATAGHLHGALVQAMADGGYQPGWRQMVDGQWVETWYHRGLDQTVMSVRWSTEAGYLQSTFRQPGPLKVGEVRGNGAPGDLIPAAKLEDTLRALNVVVMPGDAVPPASLQDAYRQRQRDLETFLLERGFRPTWTREDPPSTAWYHPGLDMTVLCITWPVGNGMAQMVIPVSGWPGSSVIVPED